MVAYVFKLRTRILCGITKNEVDPPVIQKTGLDTLLGMLQEYVITANPLLTLTDEPFDVDSARNILSNQINQLTWDDFIDPKQLKLTKTGLASLGLEDLMARLKNLWVPNRREW